MDEYLVVIDALNEKLNKAKIKKLKLQEEQRTLETELGESAIFQEESNKRKEKLDYIEDVVNNYRKHTKFARGSSIRITIITAFLVFIAWISIGSIVGFLDIRLILSLIILFGAGEFLSVFDYLEETREVRKIRKETNLDEVQKEQARINIVLPLALDKVTALKKALADNAADIEEVDKLILDLHEAINDLISERHFNLGAIEQELGKVYEARDLEREESGQTPLVPVADSEQIAELLADFKYDPSKVQEIQKKYDKLLSRKIGTKPKNKKEGSK